MLNKKNIYMVQPNYLYGKSAHLPYAVGTLVAYAWSDERISENYCIKDILFLRESIDSVINRLENPFLIGFSSYLWNSEYNKALAKRVKAAFPECIIVFGGHQISPDSSRLRLYDFIDVVIHGEGEEVFKELLLSYLDEKPLDSVPNLFYRNKDGVVCTSRNEVYTACDYPSPYLTGCFDALMAKHPELDFMFLFETNRGCAFNCAYCDWGHLHSKLRCFPFERVTAEFNWMCEHKIGFCGCADANFGVLPRDSEIIDMLIELKNKTGYPQKFQASYAKTNSDRIFEISKKLSDNGMNKGVTLAFQSLSDTVLENVGRKNISVNFYSELLHRYNAENIPTYTELILGLPGETYDSFADGIDSLISAGQHNSMYIHLCEWLPGSMLASKEYMEKYKIKSTLVLLNQPHMESPKGEDIQEYSHIITETYSMDSRMWIETDIFSCCVQCFHHMGLLELVAIYLHNEKNVRYRSFYERLIAFMKENPDTICGATLADIYSRLEKVLSGSGSLVVYDRRFGDVEWPFEEFAFLNIIYEQDRFYSEIKPFLESFGLESDILNELLLSQSLFIKRPFCEDFKADFSYDFYSYFESSFAGKSSPLVKRECTVVMHDSNVMHSWQDYARYVAWYGRKDNRNFYSKELSLL